MGSAIQIFDTNILRFVCVSDTHNDDCRDHIPDGDILLHAGDMTNSGSLEELQIAVDWIISLPHAVKVVVAGNHDLSLDKENARFQEKAVKILKSMKAQNAGLRYLDNEVETVAMYRGKNRELRPLRIYGNPMQPEFLGMPYAFIYPPAPSEAATAAWAAAPKLGDGVDIWLMHSPPLGRLDRVTVPGLTGCAVQAEKISQARPLLCVFGHYHYSWGVERVTWEGDSDAVEHVEHLATSKELQDRGGNFKPAQTKFDFSGNGSDRELVLGSETLFVNAAWMTMKKTDTTYRNPPFTILLKMARN